MTSVRTTTSDHFDGATRDCSAHPRLKSNNFTEDVLEHVTVGDPDPTSDPDRVNGSGICGFEWADEISTLVLDWSCTRELRHQGHHLAGTGEWVAAVRVREDH
jgi:hypothetical protein